MRVLFDTNVILDVLLERQPHAPVAIELVDHVARKNLDGLLGATTVTTIHYLAEKEVGGGRARRHITTLLSIFDVAAVTRAVLSDALELSLKDYEDAVLHEAASYAGATGIVTRNTSDFRGARLRIYTPAELLRLIQATLEN